MADIKAANWRGALMRRSETMTEGCAGVFCLRFNWFWIHTRYISSVVLHMTFLAAGLNRSDVGGGDTV